MSGIIHAVATHHTVDQLTRYATVIFWLCLSSQRKQALIHKDYLASFGTKKCAAHDRGARIAP